MPVTNLRPWPSVMGTSVPVSIVVIVVVPVFNKYIGVHSKDDFYTGAGYHNEAGGSYQDDFRWSHFLCLSWWDAPMPRRNTAMARRDARRCVSCAACEKHGEESNQEKLTILDSHSAAKESKRYAMESPRRIVNCTALWSPDSFNRVQSRTGQSQPT